MANWFINKNVLFIQDSDIRQIMFDDAAQLIREKFCSTFYAF